MGRAATLVTAVALTAAVPSTGCFQVIARIAPEAPIGLTLPAGVVADALPAMAMSRLVVAVAPTEDDGPLPYFWLFWGFVALFDVAFAIVYAD